MLICNGNGWLSVGSVLLWDFLHFHNDMMSGSKVINHVVLAHKWFCDFITRPNMRIKVGRMPHDIRIWGRIVGVRSTKQFVRHLLTPTS